MMTLKLNKKGILSLLTVVAIFMQIFLSPLATVVAWASEKDAGYEVGTTDSGKVIKSSVKPGKSLLKSTGTSSGGSWSSWYDGLEVYTPYISVDGKTAFCIQAFQKFPVNENYTESVLNDEAVYNILYYGYPYNGTSQEDYVNTFAALNIYYGEFSSDKIKNDSRVKYLLDKARDKTAPHGSFDIKNKSQTASWNETTKRQETGWYETVATGNNNSYTLNLPAGIKAVTTDGQEYSGTVKLDIMQNFKLVADARYNGTIDLSIPTDIVNSVVTKFTPSDSGFQQLVMIGDKTEKVTLSGVKATFKAQIGDLEITKKGNDTSSLLPNAKYEVKDETGAIVATPTTNADGKVVVKDLIRGAYTVTETTAPNGYLVASSSQNITVSVDATSQVTFTNIAVLGKATVIKHDGETGVMAQGDAILDGAEFDILNASGAIVDHVVIVNGKAQTKNLPLGNYTAKETKPGVGYNLQTKVFPFALTYKDQNTAIVYTDKIATNDVIKGKIEINKYSHSNEGGSGFLTGLADAEFTIIHKASGKEVAKVTTDANGHMITPALPYGQYIVKESKTPTGFFKIGDFDVEIEENNKTLTFNIVDGDFKSPMKIVKKDKETGKSIFESSAIFKIKDMKTGKWVEQKINYPKPATLSEFETNDEGYLILPTELKMGDYELYEIKAPNGYVLDKTAVKFSVNETTFQDGLVTIDVVNEAQKATLSIEKNGEALESADKKTGEFGDQYSFNFGQKALAGVEFDLIAKEDIITGDGTIRHYKGDVVDHIVTGENGKVTSNEQYLGKYELVETKAPFGYILSEKQDITFAYVGQDIEVTNQAKVITNTWQSLGINIHKAGEFVTDWQFGHYYTDTKALAGVTFGVYTKDAIQLGDKVLVPANSLVAVSKTDKDGIARVAGKYPVAQFYAKELKTTDSHDMSTQKFDFNYQATSNNPMFDVRVQDSDKAIVNYLHKETITLKKLNEVSAKQDGTSKTSKYEASAQGAVFGLYSEQGELLRTVSVNGESIAKFLDIPVGTYTIKEIKTSSDKYKLSTQNYKVLVSKTGILVTDTTGKIVDAEQGVNFAVKNDLKKGTAEISKQEIGGSGELPGAELQVKGENTDIRWISTDKPKMIQLEEGTYTLSETLPNDGYQLNTEAITFEVKDGKVTKVVMHNKRVPAPAKVPGKPVVPKSQVVTKVVDGKISAPEKIVEAAPQKVGNLPKTGDTSMDLLVIAGIILLVGTSVIVIQKRRRNE
ncbi:LPXTG-motif cell wall anchor domain-containing protein [Listeria weihenstephanensis FSL R9-0317]|uniref:SpaA isopeptide-forming pilin-related protein n=1 Tax=Listeria weihenstephanensis TaxID=1006155 RepID=UPI0003E858FE|nr:SpaA isopeptide-forming pilin-related protein [Listeria weihenstephanensis]EUJ38261.1 LPXTG-motif cell wall anchor domain-containing protein [Listeria weihenstephanensis FSL R9-0317]